MKCEGLEESKGVRRMRPAELEAGGAQSAASCCSAPVEPPGARKARSARPTHPPRYQHLKRQAVCMQGPGAGPQTEDSTQRTRKLVQGVQPRKTKGQSRKTKSFHFDLLKYLYSRVLCLFIIIFCVTDFSVLTFQY